MTMLAVSDLEASYGQGVVLDGISFEVGAGQVVSVLGPNGAGKTTVLRAITGLVAVSGRIVLDGEEITGKPPEALARRGVAHVPEGRGTFSDLSVEENLLVGGYTRGRDLRRDINRAYEWFPRLAERREQRGGSLSGGEQQMLAIARGLMLRPRLLLLDEPSLGLAPILTRELYRILVEIARDEGITLLVVEQNANLVLPLSDHAYVLESGRIALEGDAQSVMSDDRVQRSYLGI